MKLRWIKGEPIDYVTILIVLLVFPACSVTWLAHSTSKKRLPYSKVLLYGECMAIILEVLKLKLICVLKAFSVHQMYRAIAT